MGLDRADVVVVGGGIVGVSCAWFLADAGLDVVLLEQRELAFGASGRNMGYLVVGARRAGTELALARAGRALYDDFQEQLGDVFEYRSSGGLAFFRDEEARPLFEQHAASRRRDGLDVVVLDREEALEAAPVLAPDIAGALFCAEDGQIRTPRFVRALGAACRRRGVRVHEGVTALGLVRDGSRVRGVRTAWGDVASGTVVWAGGAWSGALANEGVTVPIAYERLGALLTGPVPVRVRQVLYGPSIASEYDLFRTLPGYMAALVAGDGTPAWNGRFLETVAQTEGGNLLVGCAMDAPAELDDRLPVDALRRMLDAFSVSFPHLRDAGVERTWAGVVPATADGLPIVDVVDEAPGLVLATGHGFGNVAGLITGRLVRELVCEQPPSLDLSHLRLSRESLRAPPGPTSPLRASPLAPA